MKALAIIAVAAVLGGCASKPVEGWDIVMRESRDPCGTWMNCNRLSREHEAAAMAGFASRANAGSYTPPPVTCTLYSSADMVGGQLVATSTYTCN